MFCSISFSGTESVFPWILLPACLAHPRPFLSLPLHVSPKSCAKLTPGGRAAQTLLLSIELEEKSFSRLEKTSPWTVWRSGGSPWLLNRTSAPGPLPCVQLLLTGEALCYCSLANSASLDWAASQQLSARLPALESVSRRTTTSQITFSQRNLQGFPFLLWGDENTSRSGNCWSKMVSNGSRKLQYKLFLYL